MPHEMKGGIFFRKQAVCLLLLGLTGCASRELPPPGPVLVKEQARLLYEPPDGERLVLDAILTEESDGTARLSVGKERPSLQIVLSGGEVRVGGEWARWGWRGVASEAPSMLRGWIAVLDAWQLARKMSGHRIEVHRPTYRMQFLRTGSSPGSLEELVVVSVTESRDLSSSTTRFVLKFY